MGCVLAYSTIDVDQHDTGLQHPERPARLAAAARGLQPLAREGGITWMAGRRATRAELTRVHAELYLNELEQFVNASGGLLDPDTPTVAGSWDTALWAAGAGLAAVEDLDDARDGSAFVLVRPPGHHAGRSNPAGFCLLNNIAVTARALTARGERVLIVDWDVHHGNGTQALFWNDSSVLYVSTHQWPAYPGTGRASEIGGPDAPGLVVNVPLPAGATGDVVREAIETVAAPVVDVFGPTWVLISAGFDAHRSDPLADLMLTAADFADLTALVTRFAPQPGRVIAFLEGGYDLDALELSVAATASELCGRRSVCEPASSGGPGHEAVRAATQARLRSAG